MKNDQNKNKLQDCLKELYLANTSKTIDEHIQNAAKNNLSHEQFLIDLLEEELTYRKQKRIESRIRQAQIPTLKTLDQFDFDFPEKIAKQHILTFVNSKFIFEKKNIILIGSPSVGKTHIASALTYYACLNDYKCRFVTASNLILELQSSLYDNTMVKCLKRFMSYQLLVIDELGYLPFDKQGCDLLFQIISNRYENGSIIVTTNRPFREWDKLFNGDSVLATAIIDRLVHHGEIIKIDGDSYRCR